MNRKVLSAAAGLAAVAVLAAGCSDPPSRGYVYSINYEPPSSTYWPGHWSQSCSGTGAARTCTSYYVQGWTEYFPAEWQLDLCADRGEPSKQNSCGWRDVDSQTYHTVRLGQWWSAVAGATPPASSGT